MRRVNRISIDLKQKMLVIGDELPPEFRQFMFEILPQFDTKEGYQRLNSIKYAQAYDEGLVNMFEIIALDYLKFRKKVKANLTKYLESDKPKPVLAESRHSHENEQSKAA